MGNIKENLEVIGKAILQDAKAKAPTKTGKLKQELKVRTYINKNDSFGIEVSGTSYTQFVNNGTEKIKAKPFLSDAIKNNLPQGINSITRELTQDIVERILKQKK